MAESCALPQDPQSAQLIFTDAACKPNGDKNAYGAFRVHFGEDNPRNVCVLPLVPSVPPHTNNRVHLMAIAEAIKRFRTMATTKTSIIFSCSKYAVS